MPYDIYGNVLRPDYCEAHPGHRREHIRLSPATQHLGMPVPMVQGRQHHPNTSLACV